MLIENLTLRNFRGIGTEFKLNLAVPITIVYAFNGTGKTTICDSAEWLMTGRVDRLFGNRVGQKAKEAEASLGSWYLSDNSSMEVEAVGYIDGSKLRVRRRSGNRLHVKKPERWTPLKPIEFLEQLSGDGVPSGSRKSRTTAMRQWVRSTWFLDGERLSHLVDSDDHARIVRSRIFASLFGVEELGSQIQHMRDIEIAMNNRWLDAGSSQLEQRLERERALSVVVTQSELSDYRHEIETELSKAEADIQYQSQTDSLSIGRVEAVRYELQRRVEARLRKREHLEYLFKFQNDAKAWGEELDRLKIAIDRLQDEINKSKEKAEQLEDGKRKIVVDINLLEEKNRRTVPLRIKLRGMHDEINSLAVVDSVEYSTIDKLEADYQVLLAQSHLQETQINGLTEFLEGGVDRFVGLCRRYIGLGQEESECEEILSSIEDVEQLKVLSNNAIKEYTSLNSKIEETGDTYEQLFLIADKLLSTQEVGAETHDCPLCGHDHGSMSSLQQAILHARRDQSPTMENLLSKTREIAEKQKSIQAILELSERTHQHRTTIRRRRDEVFTTLSKVLPRGFQWEPSSDYTLLLSDMREELTRLNITHKQTLTEMDRVRPVWSYIRVVKKVKDELLSTQDQLQSVDVEINTGFDNELSRDTLFKKLSELLAAFEHRYSITERVVNEKRVMLGRMKSSSVDTQEQLVRLSSEYETSLGKLKSLQLDNNKYLQTLRGLGFENTDLINFELENYNVQLNEQQDKAVAERLDQVADGIARLRELVNEEGRLKVLIRDLEDRKKISDERHRWKAGVQSAIQVLEDTRRLRMEEQHQPLKRLLWAIYSRAQAHHVLDEISIDSSEDGALEWVPKMFDYEVKNLSHLSRGQRIDLAISIFLARGMSEGGTFFLDEPVLHLDDLNRVGILDVLRVIAQTHGDRMRIVLTTADLGLVRHFREKFGLLAGEDQSPLLQIVHLSGNPKAGVSSVTEEVVRQVEHDSLRLLPSKHDVD